jgi:hypothetical protein
MVPTWLIDLIGKGQLSQHLDIQPCAKAIGVVHIDNILDIKKERRDDFGVWTYSSNCVLYTSK